eukprot:3972903-Pyramimonas_sp.AAC.1
MGASAYYINTHVLVTLVRRPSILHYDARLRPRLAFFPLVSICLFRSRYLACAPRTLSLLLLM